MRELSSPEIRPLRLVKVLLVMLQAYVAIIIVLKR